MWEVPTKGIKEMSKEWGRKDNGKKERRKREKEIINIAYILTRNYMGKLQEKSVSN
jgi:hypothetical protein